LLSLLTDEYAILVRPFCFQRIWRELPSAIIGVLNIPHFDALLIL